MRSESPSIPDHDRPLRSDGGEGKSLKATAVQRLIQVLLVECFSAWFAGQVVEHSQVDQCCLFDLEIRLSTCRIGRFGLVNCKWEHEVCFPPTRVSQQAAFAVYSQRFKASFVKFACGEVFVVVAYFDERISVIVVALIIYTNGVLGEVVLLMLSLHKHC